MKGNIIASVLIISCFTACTSVQIDARLEMNTNGAAPLTIIASIGEGVVADSIVVDFRAEGHSFAVAKSVVKERIAIVGAKANREYRANIILYRDGKEIGEREGIVLRTPTLSDDPALMPKIVVAKADTSRMESGYTLFNPRRNAPRTNDLDDSFNQEYGMLMATDAMGEVVWYYTCDSRISDFDILSNGNLTYLRQDNVLVEIDWAGNVIDSWYTAEFPEKINVKGDAKPIAAQTMHHDVSQLPNGNFVALGTEWREFENYPLSYEENDLGRQKVMADVIYEFTPEGEVVWEWNTFDYLNPYLIGYETFHKYWMRRGFPDVKADWSHANYVVYDKADDALLVNYRHISLIVKIDRKSGDIVWGFGPDANILKDKSKHIKITSGNNPWHQHSPEITPRGSLVFFNNNNYMANPPAAELPIEKAYSYVSEYAIDIENMTAKEIWNSKIDGEQKVISVAMGDVDCLPKTGNILAAYGAMINRDIIDEIESVGDSRRNINAWTMMREFSHTTPAEIVWEMHLEKLNDTTKIGWNLFGAERFEF